jgi:parallel beta-helix repeat protein
VSKSTNPLKLEINDKAALVLMLLSLTASCIIAIQPVKSQLTSREIHIKPDGTVVDSNPVTPIQKYGNVYTFTGDIYGRLDVERSNIVIDGAGYSLKKSELDFAVNVGTGVDHPYLVGVNDVTLMNMEIVGFNYGITLGGANNVVSGVNITAGPDYNGVAIWVTGPNNVVRGCRITANRGFGLYIHARGVVLSDNYIADNGHSGIYFQDRAAMLRNNALNNNTLGPFYMDESSTSVPGEPFQITSNDIDPSNMVDGKPVYYWVNEQDKTIPSNAGYVVLDNCTNVKVKDLSINRNSAGRFVYGSAAISLIRTKNSVLENNILNGTGIYISYSSQDIYIANNKIAYGGIYSWGSNISIIENFVSASKDSGISVGGSPATAIITKNTLTECETGISLQSSSQNRVIQNSITDCGTGISIFSSNNNVFYHNSFVNNKQQVSEQHYALQWPLNTYYQSFNNTWDSNFWSDYNGTDANGDGVGDTPYLVYENYTDHHPLMASFIPVVVQPSASPSSSPSSSPTATPQIPEPFPTAPVVAASVASVVVIGMGLLILFKRRKR